MATITVNISSFSLSVSGNTQVNGNITWAAPIVPDDVTIVSCTLTGRATASMSKGSTTTKVNNSTVSSGSNFTVNLGTDIDVTSVAVNTKGGNKNANGTVTFDNLVYTVEYEEPGTEEPEPEEPGEPTGDNIFPPFTDGNWILDSSVATNTLLENYSYGFTTQETSGWIGYYAPVPESWYGHAIKLSVESITDNASLCIQTAATYEEIFALNATKTEGIVRVTPGEEYIIFVRTNYLGSGDVLVTNVVASDEGLIPNIDTLTLTQKPFTAEVNTSSTIKCSFTPEDAIYRLEWSVNDPSITLNSSNNICNILPTSLGTYTLTVTDSLTGISDSCEVNVIEGGFKNENIFPPFNGSDAWYLDATCNLTDLGAYNCEFKAASTWSGISINVPDSWYGRKIQLKCETISENACLYIQETDTWSEIGVLSPENRMIEIEMPEQGTYTNIVLVLQAHSDYSIPISITGVEAFYTDVTFDPNQTWIDFENRIVGYKPAAASEIISGATVCQSANEISNAIKNAKAGDTIYLRRGFYTFTSGLNINVQGSASNYITIKSYPGEIAAITNSQINFTSGAKYINFEDIVISDVYDLHWGTALKVGTGTSYLNFRNLEIYNITCREIVGDDTSGCNPFVVYADGGESISNINIENCYIHDCDTGWSEALTLNGNVSNCLIKNCTIKDITNIGIDLAGNYEWTGTVGDPNNQTHDCIVENCLIMNCQSPYATSAGLYSDGARDNTFRYNVIYNCQCGIELGSEQPGSVSENFHVHNNLIIDSGRCIGIGAYLETGAKNRNAYICNNTFVCGDSNKENYGLYVERTENVNFYNNIVYGTANTSLFSNGYNSSVNIGSNCWYKPFGSKPASDTTGFFADPQFKNNNLTIFGDYRLLDSSPCIDAGVNSSSDQIGDLDLNGNIRINRRVDIGAFESLSALLSSLKIKEAGSWIDVLRVYKKISGKWVLQTGTALDTLLPENVRYIFK